MKSRSFVIGLLFIAILLSSACSKHEKVGSSYVLVTPLPSNPDHHPGTALYELLGSSKKLVWPNVFTGYYYDQGSSAFFHDHTLVFVASIPQSTGDYGIYQHVFAVSPGGVPVLVSDVITKRKTENLPDRVYPRGFSVRSIHAESKTLSVTFEFFADPDTNSVETYRMRWSDLKSALGEIDGMPPIVTPLGTFRRAHPQPNQSPQHNAGSRPSSGDSSASETPTSLGPRG